MVAVILRRSQMIQQNAEEISGVLTYCVGLPLLLSGFYMANVDLLR